MLTYRTFFAFSESYFFRRMAARTSTLSLKKEHINFPPVAVFWYIVNVFLTRAKGPKTRQPGQKAGFIREHLYHSFI